LFCFDLSYILNESFRLPTNLLCSQRGMIIFIIFFIYFIVNTCIKKLRTNEEELINVLCNRTIPQRMEIAKLYYENYSKDLMKTIQDDTLFNFKKILVALGIFDYSYNVHLYSINNNLVTPTNKYLAEHMKKTARFLRMDNSDFIQILTSSNNRTVSDYVIQ
jgi:hypothetical protein